MYPDLLLKIRLLAFAVLANCTLIVIHSAGQEDSGNEKDRWGSVLEQQCLACHSIPGHPGDGLSHFSRAPEISLLSPSEFKSRFEKLLAGSESGEVSGYLHTLDHSPDHDRHQAIGALAGFAGNLADDSLHGDSDENPDEGWEIFNSRGCQICHGTDGRGGTGLFPLTDGSNGSRLTGAVRFSWPGRDDPNGMVQFNATGHPWVFRLPPREAKALESLFNHQKSDSPLKGGESDISNKTSGSRELGATLWVKNRCQSCHQDDVLGELPVRIPLDAGKLSKGMPWHRQGGEIDGLPQYKLPDGEATLISSALHGNSVGVETLSRLAMADMQCFHCHSRGTDGPDDLTRQYFHGSGDDLGDEGRIPPALSDPGRKFQSRALIDILRGHGAVRPYMSTLMPGIGESRAGVLAAWLAEADRIDNERPTPRLGQENQVGRNMWGRELLGSTGLGCIVCHPIGGHKSLGIQAIDLSTVTGRLRPEWFRDYLIDPSGFRPGTRMPSFWPEGKPSRPGSGGSTDRQIDSIWAYLLEHDQSRLPAGLEAPDEFLLEPDGEPVAMRTFFRQAGLHALVLGFPAGTHVAIDLVHQRPAVIWTGDFLDAAHTWDNRFTPWTDPASQSNFSLFDDHTIAGITLDGQLPGSIRVLPGGYQILDSGSVEVWYAGIRVSGDVGFSVREIWKSTPSQSLARTITLTLDKSYAESTLLLSLGSFPATTAMAFTQNPVPGLRVRSASGPHELHISLNLLGSGNSFFMDKSESGGTRVYLKVPVREPGDGILPIEVLYQMIGNYDKQDK